VNGLTAVSLFAGVGGFDLALQRSGADVVAAVEIDADCRGVLARHFPQTALFNDVSEVTGDQLRAAGLVPGRGILAGGFPCQDLSVAGRRAGLDGARSGLFWEFHRLAEELRPAWLLIENVPGMLSSNGGGDFRIVMDALSDLGYIIDPNIYDAQHFGVPQRRRRVFLICQLLDHSLQSKTTSSALMLAQCLIETSLLSLTVLSQGSARGSAPWDSPARCADGLRKRIKLFGMERQLESICKTWLPVLAGESVRQALARSTSASPPGSSTAAATGQKAAMSSPDSTLPAGVTSLSTASSWRKLLADLLPIAKSCTTSTPSKQATSQAIFTCARALLNISEYIAALSSSSPNSWQPVSSASTAIEVLTKYARSADGDLLAELNGLHDLVDLIAPAERARRLFVAGCLGDGAAAAEVLLEPESGDGNPAAGREAGPGDAGAPSGRAGIPRTVGTLGTTSPGGGWRCGADEAAAGQLVAATLQGGGRRGHRIDAEGAAGGHLIAAPLTAGSATGDGVNKPGRRQEDDLTSSPRLKPGDSTERFTARPAQYKRGGHRFGVRYCPPRDVASPTGEEVPSCRSVGVPASAQTARVSPGLTPAPQASHSASPAVGACAHIQFTRRSGLTPRLKPGACALQGTWSSAPAGNAYHDHLVALGAALCDNRLAPDLDSHVGRLHVNVPRVQAEFAAIVLRESGEEPPRIFSALRLHG